jgi:signal transduction histidine kinase
MQLHLGSILMLLDRGDLAPEEHRRRVERAAKSCARLGDLIEQLLDVTRIGVAAHEPEAEEFDLASLACDLVERLGAQARLAGCRLVVDAAAPVPGRWPRLRVEQILANLLSNAITYAPGAPIHVAVAEDRSRALLSVRDNGPGIPEGDRTRVFERFVRGSTGTGNGFGLGLWLVRTIAERLGGSVTLRTADGAGCTFTVELPLE